MAIQTVKISDLTDGDNLIKKSSVLPFSQDGVTYKGGMRPQAANQISVRNQDQLEAELGTDLEVLGNLTIYNDSPLPLVLDKPFKMKDMSILSLNSSNRFASYDWQGTGPGITNSDDSVSGAGVFILDNVNFAGDGNNKFIDLKLDPSLQGFSLIRDAQIDNYSSLGKIDGLSHSQSLVSYADFDEGLVIKNAFQSNLERVSCDEIATDYTTFLSWIASPSYSSFVTLRDVKAGSSIFANNNLLYFDPNTILGSFYQYTDCSTPPSLGNIVQLGLDIDITLVENVGGFCKFTAASAHNLNQNSVTRLLGFTGETSYNKTALVTAISGLTFTTDIPFVSNDTTGKMNSASMDSTNVKVLSFANPRRRDSMFIGKISQSDTVLVSGIGIGADVALGGTYGVTELERFIDAGSNLLPRLQNKDTSEKRYSITYSTVLSKTGTTRELGLILRKNFLTDNDIVSVNPISLNIATTQVPMTNTEIVSLGPDDTIEPRLKNYDGGSVANNITYKNTTMVVNRA